MKKRIGMILDQEFRPDIRVENEALSLIKNGYEVYIWCYTFTQTTHLIDHKGIKLYKNHISSFWMRKMRALVNVISVYDKYLIKSISSFIKKFNIEILHVHDLYLLGAVLKLKRKYQLPIISDLHENYVEGLKYYKFANSFPGNILINIKKWEETEKKWLNDVDYIIVVVEEAKERLKKIGIDNNKTYPVQNFLNIDEYKEYNINEKIKEKYKDNFIISYVGAIDFHRGLHILIKGFAEVVKKDNDMKLLIVGNGKILSHLKELTIDLKIQKHVEFAGFQPHDSLPSYIEASHICTVPHLKTGHTDNTLPHKLFQYMYKQKPVLVSDCVPLERIVNECQCGKVYKNDDPSSLAQQLRWFLEHKNKLPQLGKNGKNYVINKYNWFSAEKNLLKLYERFV